LLYQLNFAAKRGHGGNGGYVSRQAKSEACWRGGAVASV